MSPFCRHKLSRHISSGKYCCAGLHIHTGEEVGIKLVWHNTKAVTYATLNAECLLHVQESIKTKHPQLLYESKLYKILQGGSMFPTAAVTL